MSSLEEKLEDEKNRARLELKANLEAEYVRSDKEKDERAAEMERTQRDMEERIQTEQAKLNEAARVAREKKERERLERNAAAEAVLVPEPGAPEIVMDDRYWAREALGQMLAHMEKTVRLMGAANLWRFSKALDDQRRQLLVYAELLDEKK